MSLQGISRQNRQRAITVFANVARGSSQAKAIEEIQRISKTFYLLDILFKSVEVQKLFKNLCRV